MIVRGCLCLVAKKMRSYAQIENYHVNYNKNYVYKFIIFLQTKHQLKIFAKYIFLQYPIIPPLVYKIEKSNI